MPQTGSDIVVTARFLPLEFESGGGGGSGGGDAGMYRDYDALEDNPKGADGSPVNAPGDVPPILNDNGLLTQAEKAAFSAAVAYLTNKIANMPVTPANHNTNTPLGVVEATALYSGS